MFSRTSLLCWWEGLGPFCLFQLRVGDPSVSFSNLKKAASVVVAHPSQLQGDSLSVWKLPILQPEAGFTRDSYLSPPAQQAGLDCRWW